MITGKKVGLREARRSDITHLLKWFNDPEVTRYLSMCLPMTEMHEERFVETLGTRDAFFIMETIETASPVPLGTISINETGNRHRNGIFGLAIGEKDYWGNGYGTEASRLIIRYGFEQLNLHRIISSVDSRNERSLRLHRAVGFIEEGRQREQYFRDGVYGDKVMFGLLKREWEENNKES